MPLRKKSVMLQPRNFKVFTRFGMVSKGLWSACDGTVHAAVRGFEGSNRGSLG